MHVTACLAGQKEEVEVGEDCRNLQALREAIVKALPQLCVEGFDVSVGGRALDSDDGVVSLEEAVCVDVVPNARGLSVLALREAGREVNEDGLIRAASEGDVSAVTLYLDAGVPIDCVDDDGSTPLLSACFHGHLSIAILLLDRGSNAFDTKAVCNTTPLYYACKRGDLSIATLLLDRGSKAIDTKAGHGVTPLHNACRDGNLSIATLLLDRGSKASDEKDDMSATPFLCACRNGHLSIATLLLDRGSKAIDEATDDDSTPLHYACEHGYLSIATLLLDRGSKAIDEENHIRVTPLHNACSEGHLSIATLLLDRGSKAIDETDDLTGRTPLLYACCQEDLPLVTLLLDRGCSVDAEAFRTGGSYSQEVLELLSERGHDVLPDASVKRAKRRRTGEQ